MKRIDAVLVVPMPSPETGYITIARVVKTQGRHGEVACALHTDFPERFAERTKLSAWLEDGSRRELALEEHWPHKGLMVLKFSGVDDMSAAEKLIGAELQVPAEERTPLPAGELYISDLAGCELYDAGKRVGTVCEVRFGAGEAPLLVLQGASGKEILVPFAEAYIAKVDPASKRVEMNLPAGLLAIDAPLSEEEKRLQQEQD